MLAAAANTVWQGVSPFATFPVPLEGDELGWAFREGPGYSHDPINHFMYLREAYAATDQALPSRRARRLPDQMGDPIGLHLQLEAHAHGYILSKSGVDRPKAARTNPGGASALPLRLPPVSSRRR